MRDFNEYKKDFNGLKVYYGEKIFQKQLSSLEGVEILIDGIEAKCLIINDGNTYHEKKEFRTICMNKDVKCNHGSYVVYDNEQYIVVTDIDDHYYYKSCKIRKCNNVLKWVQDGIVYEYPCILANDSYGVKQSTSSGILSELEIKTQIQVQNNEYTSEILPNLRVMFSNSKTDVYKTISINKSITSGVIIITCANDEFRPHEDDLMNNLCANENNNEVNEPVQFEIIGEDIIKHETQATYKLSPLNDSCHWSIDESSVELEIAKIVSQDSETCIIYGYKVKGSEFFTLYAKNEDGTVLAKKTIVIKKNIM